uniref:CSON006470 protein n=1 Tax=Culicoides sonorensis TaxID=179676 RepID=A0A336MYN0_CULSO
MWPYYTILIILLFVYCIISPVKCDILVYTQSTSTIIEEFPDAPARFGAEIPASGLRVLAIKGNPENGCGKIEPPPNITIRHLQWCVVVARYNCSFEAKIRNAQAAGYDAVIVHNVGSNELEPMSAGNDNGIVIPAVFVGESTGKIINYNYQWNEDFALLINNESPFNINTHLLLPFTVVVGLCFITMIIFTIVRCCRERRRNMRYRLPKSVLKKIPTLKFVRGVHQYDTCAICLEDYVDGEKLRVLHCGHAYHCKCIDPWLTKNRRVCPMCKRKVFVRGEKRPRRTSSDNSSSSDADDTTPLLTANESQNDHGTFQQDMTPGQSSVSVSQWPSNNGTMSEDDELLDATATDDDPLESVERLTVWQKFKRIFKRQTPLNEEVTIEDGISNNTTSLRIPSSSINFGAHSSNNLLNTNLSGSFQRNTDETTDDENILISSRQNRSAPNLSSNRRNTQQPVAGSSSSNSTGRIGVPAIPNNNFNPSPPISRGRSNMILYYYN